MTNLELLTKVRENFVESIKLLKQIKIEDKDEIKMIIETFGSMKTDDGGIFSQLSYIEEDIIEEDINE